MYVPFFDRKEYNGRTAEGRQGRTIAARQAPPTRSAGQCVTACDELVTSFHLLIACDSGFQSVRK